MKRIKLNLGAPTVRVIHQMSKVSQSAIILEIQIFIRFCMVNGQALPIQFICHTEPYIKATIFKLMVLHDTLVYDSDNWFTY